ncbi:alpha/beta-hydrolase [Flagelloscypha sp. PMI_526]|nr:alpha/beta-hydrolase [Flagelloscypha sp. PMI_526]
MSPITITYSHLQGISLEFDLWLPSSTTSSKPLPIVIFFHGGGLMSGSKNDAFMSTWVKDLSIQRGFACIAADYPLIHPLTYKDIIAQTQELFTFISSPSVNDYLPSGTALNPERIAVTGFSAGGYVARIAAIHAQPKPVATILAFGMGGDFLNDAWINGNKTWLRENSPFPTPADPGSFLENPPRLSVDSPLFFDPEKSAVVDSEGRLNAWFWLVQHGLFLDYFTGLKGLTKQLAEMATEKERYAKVTELGLVDAFPEIHLSDAWNAVKFPPSYFYHGGADPLIFPGESQKTFAALKEAGVETELVVVPGAIHGMINPLTNQLQDGVEDVQATAFAFIAKQLSA